MEKWPLVNSAADKGCIFSNARGDRSCGCWISNRCWASGEVNTANPCDMCQPDLNPNGWSLNDLGLKRINPSSNVTCSDNIPCTWVSLETHSWCKIRRSIS